MGSFNQQYERYYKNLKSRSNFNNRIKRSNNFNPFNGNYFVRRIIRDLIGVSVLLILILTCKIIIIPQTQTVYDYSKKVVSTNFDYKAAADEIKKINFSAIRIKAADFLEKIKTDNSLE